MNPATREEFLLKSKRRISIPISINSKRKVTIIKTLMKIVLIMVLALWFAKLKGAKLWLANLQGANFFKANM